MNRPCTVRFPPEWAAAARRDGTPVWLSPGSACWTWPLAGAVISTAYVLADVASYPEESFDAPCPLLEQLGTRIAGEHLASPGGLRGGVDATQVCALLLPNSFFESCL